jgi:hypothetical protein
VTFGKAGLALAMIFASALARAAGPSPADVATARELYTQGSDALDSGRPKEAADKLAQAWALVQTPVIGLDLARAQMALGHLVEAREAVLGVQRIPSDRNETARSTQARADADKLAAQLAPRIAHVHITLKGVTGDAQLTAKLDGEEVPQMALTVERSANPGAHVAIVDLKDGRHGQASVTLTEGESREIVIEVPPLESQATPSPQHAVEARHDTHAPVEPPTPPSKGGTSPIVWIGVALGGAGLVLGAVTGAFAMNASSTLKNDCTLPNLTGDGKSVCGPNDAGKLSDANTFATLSTVGFVAAGVGVAVTIVGVLLSHKPKPSATGARILPVFGPISGVVGTF